MIPTKWVLEDPDGGIHHVELDGKGQWHGAENIAMCISEHSARILAKDSVLRTMATSLADHGSWGHYTWIRQP